MYIETRFYQSSSLHLKEIKMNGKSDIGLIGLAVMGENLVLNMESRNFSVSVYNRTASRTDEFLKGRGAGKNIKGFHSAADFTASLKSPRRIMIMVKAGKPVDDTIETLLPHLDKGDIIIDGGNSHYTDTIRRNSFLREKGLLFVGAGVSGGEEGALKGPSIMPGGSSEAWPHIKDIFQAIAAKVDDGSPCCEWVGADGAGHYVKMVHNGIEYGDMQMISEAYFLMKKGLGLSAERMRSTFEDWNKGELDSYLIEITAEILSKTDPETGKPVCDIILDAAGQKGTGKWTSESALTLGVPSMTIAEAVFARCMSAIKEERVAASKILSGPSGKIQTEPADSFINDIKNALYASKICSYAQGYQLLKAAALEQKWTLNYGNIALLWRGGCIIRAKFLGEIKKAFDRNPNLSNLLLDPYFKSEMEKCQASWRRVIAAAAMAGIPIPAFASALAYYDSYRTAELPANMLQAQRDYFGAHTFERTDKPRGQFFHFGWTESGGSTTSSSYNA